MSGRAVTGGSRSPRHPCAGALAVLLCISSALFPRSAILAAEPPRQGLDELLSYDLTELMAVEVVSASKKKQSASDAPATVRVVTAEEIRERGYLTLEDALADLPGFQFRDISGFNSYVFMRGLPSQNNLILLLVDGVQINELASGGFYAGGQYNLANVKRIEVVYGPASVLYGTNAISGLINIITNDPRDADGGRAAILGGQFGTRGADFGYGYHDADRDCGVNLSGRLYRTDKADLRGGEGDGNWSQGMENFEEDQSFDGKLLCRAVTVGVTFQDKHASRSTNETTRASTLLDSGTDWHIRFMNSYVRYALDRESWALESRVYYRTSTVADDTIASIDSVAGSTGGQKGQYRPNDAYGLENQLRLNLSDDLELTAGIVGERENLSRDFSTTYSGDPLTAPRTPGTPAMEAQGLLSLYAQAHYDLPLGLALTGGIRHDNSTSYGRVYTPRGGLVYRGEGRTVKLLYGEAFRAPRTWDTSYGAGNPDLAPERMRSLEVSGEAVLADHLAASLAAYRNEIDELFTLTANRWVNAGSIVTRGVEARLDAAVDRVKAYAHYTFQDPVDQDGVRVAEISRHTGGFGALFSSDPRLKLDLRARYLGRRRNPTVIDTTGGDSVGSSWVADATLSLRPFRTLEIQAIVKNLGNEAYYHTSNRPPDRYRQPPRQFLLRLGFVFGPDGKRG